MAIQGDRLRRHRNGRSETDRPLRAKRTVPPFGVRSGTSRVMDSGTPDRFFVLPWRDLCKVIVDGHTKYLAKHGGIRPRKPESMHTGLQPSQIEAWEGKWEILKKSVRPVQNSHLNAHGEIH
jgi:hypothetical protein